MHSNINKAVHCRWPLCVLVDEESILPEVAIINIDEGKVVQTLDILEKVVPSYLCWHEELLVLVVGFENSFEVWTLDHDLRYIELLDEGIIAPSFDTNYEEYYNIINKICKDNPEETQGFGVTDILGANHRRRLNIFWSQRYRNIKLRLFIKVDLSEVNKNDAKLKGMSWIDHNKLVIQHSSSNRGTFLTVWKFQFEIFNIDIYKEIISRRKLEKESSAFLNDLESLYIEILTGVDSKPLLEQELSFAGPRIDLQIAFDSSERFILVYQHLDNELFIWRYEYSKNDEQMNSYITGINSRISGVFPNQFQFQKISLKQEEKIINASWKPCSSRIPYKLKKLGGISELSSFCIISRNNDEIIVRIWRESSLNKPCQFVKALYLRFNNRPFVKNEDINIIWESFRDNVIHHFNSVEALDRSINDFNIELEDPSYHYSTSRFPLLEDDDDDYYYYNLNSEYDDLSKSSIPLNSCIHNCDIFTMNEKQNKVVKLIISIGKEIFCFNIYQLDIWNDEINSSICKWEICQFNNIDNTNYYNSLQLNCDFNKNNILPRDVSNIILFWKNDELSNRSNGNIYNFIFRLKDSNIAEYIFNDKTGIWNFSKLTRIVPKIQSSLKNTSNIHGKLAIELTNTNEILILLNNGHILLLDNLNPKKLFTFIHANKTPCNFSNMHTSNINVDNGIEFNNNIYDLSDLGIEKIINISEGIVSSYYQILLVQLNKGSQLRVFGLTSICENGSSSLELLDVEISDQDVISGENFDSFEGDTNYLFDNHEKILKKLFIYNSIDNQYEIVFLDKHSSVIGGYCICVCLVKDLVLRVSHIIMFEIKMSNQESLLLNQVERSYNKSRIRLELKVISTSMYQGLLNINLNGCFLLIKQPSTENSLIFVTTEIFISGKESGQEMNDNSKIKELGQLYIYICNINDIQDKIEITSKIKLNRSFFDFMKDSLLLETLDYNLLIYSNANGELRCYSLLSLNMLNIEGEEAISLNPFQEISFSKDHNWSQSKSINFSKESLQENSEKNDDLTSYDRSKNNQLIILQDFEMTYFCLLLNNGVIIGSIYWNKDVCRWETNNKIDLHDHFQMSNTGELIRIQRLEVFDGLYLFFNTNDQIIPKIYKRPENDVYERINNFSLRQIQVLEDFVFSLNDRKQSFSRQIFDKIKENIQDSPNLNIMPYNLDDSLDIYDNYNFKSLNNLGEYQRLYDSLIELRRNNKHGHRMSVMEFEECQIKRYFIRKNYFDTEREGGFVLKSEDICWISLCEEDYIVNKILENLDGNVIDWRGLKRFGVIYILTENFKFQEFIERWVQKLYQNLIKVIAEKRKELNFEFPDDQKKNSNIVQDEVLNIVLIIYTCINKLNIVSAIFKILDQKNVFDFLLNYNVSNDELRRQAVKNGYYLIKQRKYHWSLCFFILSRSYDEIANVCVKYLNDPQLLLLLLKLLININGINDYEKNTLVNLYNKHLNDLWLLSLVNKDPWLSIITILNYSSVNNFKFNNINRVDILNVLLKLSCPTIFFKVCELMSGIEDYFKSNINIEDIIQSNHLKDFNLNNPNIYDLSYSFIHPEHLFLFNNYIKLKISISSQSQSYELIESLKYPSFENIIEIISYYIKKCMNPYHYISWLSYIEKNQVLFNIGNIHYQNYYNLIIKPNIINRIQNYVRYLHINYFFFLNDNILFDWINQFSKIPEFISIFHFNFNQAKSNLIINPINIFNYLLLINVDKYFNINTGIHTENDVIKNNISRMHVACKKRLSEDISGLRGKYLNLIFEIFSEKKNYWDLNDYEFDHLWVVLFEFFSRINNEIILTLQKKSSDKNLNSVDYDKYMRNKSELLILILRNKINQILVELLFESGLEGEDTTSYGIINKSSTIIMAKLFKIYMVMIVVQELIVKMEDSRNDKISKYENFVKILKFVIILKSYQKLDLHLKKRLTKRLGIKVLKFLRLLFEFSTEYGYIKEIQGNFNNDVIQEKNQNNTFQYEKGEKLMYFNSILIVLSTSILRIHQELIDQSINNEATSNSSIQEESHTYNTTNQLNLALRESYYNRVFKEWKEIIIPLLPLILTYYYDSIDENMSVLFTKVVKTNNNQEFNSSSNSSSTKVILTKIIIKLEQIWIGMGIKDFLLLNILRNKDLIISYDVGSISNLYYYLLKKVWNFKENTINSSSSIELESSDQFSVNLLTSLSFANSSINTSKDNNDLGFKLEKLKLDFSNEYFQVSDERFRSNKKEEAIRMNNPSLFMINMLIYNNRVIPTPKLNLVPSFHNVSISNVTNTNSTNINTASGRNIEDLEKDHKEKENLINQLIDSEINQYEDDDFYYYNFGFDQGKRQDEDELEDESEYEDEEDYYYNWYKNRIQKGEKEGGSNTLLGHLLYQESPLLTDCKMDANNSPFLLLGEKTHLMLNSKLYFIHPISFMRRNHLNSYYYEDVIFQRAEVIEDLVNIFKSEKIIKLEVLLNSFLLKRLLIFGKLEENQDDHGLISYSKLEKRRKDIKSSFSSSTSSSPCIMPIYDIDFCVNIKKGIKSMYLDLYESKECELKNGGSGSNLTFNSQEIRFLQIFTDIPLSFSKIQNQFNNVKAIICGEAIQLRNPRITHIIYPYWSHSLAFSNYHKVNHPNYFIGTDTNSIGSNINISNSGKSNPKPIMISNNLSKSYCNLTLNNVNNSSSSGTGRRSFKTMDSSGQARGYNQEPTSSTSPSFNKLMVNNHHLGNITHVNWSPSKIHIIISTSNGFIMVYKLNSSNNYLTDEEDEIFAPPQPFSSPNLPPNSSNNKAESDSPLPSTSNTILISSSKSTFAPNPFIPIYIFQVHKSNCYWSGIVDHSCRYILTSGNGINFVYNTSNNANNNQGDEFGKSSLSFRNFTKYNSRGERVPVIGGNINITTTNNNNNMNMNSNSNNTQSQSICSASTHNITNAGSSYSIGGNNNSYSNNGIISESGGGMGSGGNIINSGTLNLAEFMGDNTLNLSSKIEISSVLSDENCLCIWDIWTNLSYNLALISRPDLLIALESSPISVSHNWKQANTLLIITNSGNIWFVSYLFGRQFLNPSLFKLKQKNILTSNLSNLSINNNIINRNPNYINSKLTVLSTDGTCIIYHIFLLLKSSFKRHFNNNQITIVPIIKFNINYSVSMNPLNIINNSLSSNQYNKVISHAIFINKNTLLIIDSLQNCKIVQLLPFFN
ncbi:large low complexity [Cryptosporidium sp. chipmunk genotype I]|uniref:large low complexity n=1 Tax=Cryptosporidium sp. chipmunk genotype I TaxID=1280935 RepID=UPI00351A6E81|nr:large low complexity [Cryptosporidium sp. chipmunk genotype I]